MKHTVVPILAIAFALSACTRTGVHARRRAHIRLGATAEPIRAVQTHTYITVSHLNPVWYGLRCLRVLLRYKLGRYRPGLETGTD